MCWQEDCLAFHINQALAIRLSQEAAIHSARLGGLWRFTLKQSQSGINDEIFILHRHETKQNRFVVTLITKKLGLNRKLLDADV